MIVAEKMEQCAGVSHLNCFACGTENRDGLGLAFEISGEHKVKAHYVVDKHYQGYPGIVQGGIVASILDSAMTNCLFACQIEAMTVRLNVQYHLPVITEESLTVEAELVRQRGRLYELEADLIQEGILKATASGRFMVPPC